MGIDIDIDTGVDSGMGTGSGTGVAAEPALEPGPEPDICSGEMLRVLGEVSRTVTDEYRDRPLEIEGQLPAAIDGVLFRNGPGRFERGNRRYAHPFDGDGHITRFDIGAQGIRYSNRFVRTREFIAEERSGRMRYRAFGTNLPGGIAANLFRLNFKNAANTNVVWHGGRLLALWEGGPPHRLDPLTLATLGTEDFDGQLRNPSAPPARWLSPLMPFSAHPHLDAVSGELFNFGLVSGRPNRLLIYRVDGNGRMAPWQAHRLPRFSFVHDFAVTRRWFCFLLPHADFDLTRAALGLTTAVGSLQLDNERPMQAMLIPRNGNSARPGPIDCGGGFVFHVAQAFDRDDGALVLDVVRYARYPDFGSFEALFSDDSHCPMARMERMVIDPESGRCDMTPWASVASELPTTAPGPLGEPRCVIYSVGAPPQRQAPYFTSIQRLDTANGELRSRDFGLDLVGEPLLVPDPTREQGDGEGWLLTLVYRAGEQRTDLLVLRASNLETLATARLPHAVSPGFHGCWVARDALDRR